MKFFKKAAACVLACALALSTFIGAPALAAGTPEDKTGSVPYSESRVANYFANYSGSIYYTAQVTKTTSDGKASTCDIVYANKSTGAESCIYQKASNNDNPSLIVWGRSDSGSSKSYFIYPSSKSYIENNFMSSWDIYELAIPSAASTLQCEDKTIDGTLYYTESTVFVNSSGDTYTNTYCFEKGTNNLCCYVYSIAYSDGRTCTYTHKITQLTLACDLDWNTLLPAGFPNGYTAK